MTYVEEAGLEMLKDFIKTAERVGICFNGYDMEEPVQKMIISIVKDYAEQYLEEDR